jgi:hypothetical protein
MAQYYLTEEQFNAYEQEADDKGVMCIYIEENKDWVAIEAHCLNCGYVEDECECDEPEIIPADAIVKIIP